LERKFVNVALSYPVTDIPEGLIPVFHLVGKFIDLWVRRKVQKMDNHDAHLARYLQSQAVTVLLQK
jgi:hypothetical protein